MAAADTPHHPEGADDAQVGRRVLLRGISAMGLAAFAAPALVACGSDDEAVGAKGPDATPEPVEATPEPVATNKATKTPKPEKTASAEPTESATAEATKTGKPEATPKPADGGKLVKDGDTPLAPTSVVPVNSGYLFESDELIVTQPTAGKFLGFDSLCTHEGCPVDVFDTPGEMDCACHSSKFKLDTGKPFAGPAKKPLPSKPIIIENGQIYKAKKA